MRFLPNERPLQEAPAGTAAAAAMTDTVLVFDTAASDYGPVPADAQAIAPYMDAKFRNVDAARRRFPHLFAAGMVATITALRGDADIIDWEPGNLDPPPAQWYEQQRQLGRWRPGFYEDLSDGRITVLPALVAHLGGLGPPGPARPVRIFTAHPTGTRHLCGPHTCGQFPVDADATQYWWTSRQGRFPGAGGDVDVSVARRDFFPTKTPAPGGRPQPSHRKENMIAAVVKQDGRLEVFVERGDGEVFHAYQAETNGGWAGSKQGVRTAEWYSLGTPGGSAQAGAASVQAPAAARAAGVEAPTNVAAQPVSPAPAPASDQPVQQTPAAGETPGAQQGT